MKKLLLLLGVVFATTSILAQSVANYTTSRTTSITYNSISATGNNPSAVGAWRNTLSTDDNLSAVLPIGFTFFYNGVAYTQFSMSTNGFITFNTATAATGSGTSSYGYDNTTFSNATGTFAVLAPFYDDQQTAGNLGTLADLNATYKYLTTGSVGSRVLTVEWVNSQDFSTTSTSSFNYQVKLYETTGVIEFVYGTMTLANSSTLTTMSYSLGINAATVTATPTAAQLLTLQTVNGSTFNNTASNALGGATPANMPTANSMYTFTPPLPNAPSTLLATNPTTTSMNLSWTDNSSNELSFIILRSTDDITYTIVSTLPANTVTTNVSGLTINTNYYWRVAATSEGAISASSSVQGATAATAVPLSGNYSIDNTLPYLLAHDGSGNFPSFTAAINVLNGDGMGGAVTFNVAAGKTFNENTPSITISGTVTNTITFQKSGVGANPKITPFGSAGTADFGIGIVGGDYITFNGIDIEPLNNTVEFGYYVANASTTNGATFNTIMNSRIVMVNTVSGSAGIRTAVPSTPASAAGTNSNNTFKNLTISNAYRSIWFVGNATNRDENNTVTADPTYTNAAATNTVGYNDLGNITVSGSSGMRGVEINGQSNFLITKSEVRNIVNTNTSSTNDVAGIMCNTTATSSNVTISNNLVHDITGSGTTTQVVYGIWFSGACVANVSNVTGNKVYKITGASTTSGSTRGILYNNSTAAATGNIINNMVYQLENPNNATGAPAIRGIELNSAVNVNLYHNTVFLNASYTGTVSNSFQTSCLFMSSSTGTFLDMKNNIFVNNSSTSSTGTSTRAVAFYKTTTTIGTQITTGSNNNLLYAGAPSTKNLLYYGSTGAGAQDLATYRSNSGNGINNGDALTPRESAAQTENPPFVSVTGTYDLHLSTSLPTYAEGKGTPIATVTADIDGDARNATTPDIGADEFNGVVPSPCVTPSAQPTALVANATGQTTATISFTAASPAPSNYLIVRTTASSLAATPVDATTYTVGANLIFGAGGFVESVGSSTTFNSTGLTAGTTYYYWIFSFNNNSCTGGPAYLVSSPASANTTTGALFTSITSGNWEDGSTWNQSGAVPNSISDVVIAATHTVTVNAASATANGVTVNSTGILTVSGSTLSIAATLTNSTGGTVNGSGGTINVTAAATTGITNGGTFNVNGGTVNVGITNNTFCNRTFANNSTLTITSGNLNVYGNLNNANGSTFNQSGGTVRVDGNAAGVLANSVAGGTNIFGFGTSGTGATVSLTGGSIIIVDPHTVAAAAGGTSNGHAFMYWGNGYRSGIGHTIQIGDGSSTDGGGNTSGYQYDPWPGTGYFIAGNLVINAPAGINRSVTQVYATGVEVNLTITNGELLQGTNLTKVGGNILVNSPGKLTSTGTLVLALWGSDLTSNSSNAVSVNAQTISGTGTFQNLASAATANFTGITTFNTNTSGVTFGTGITSPTLSGALTVTDGSFNADGLSFVAGAAQAVTLTAATSSINVTNLIINKSAGTATLSGSGFLNVTGTATVSAGTLTAGGRLVLKSTLSGTARITAGTGSYISGNVITETFIPGGRRAYRFLGHPFTTAQAMSSLTDDIFVTGDGTIDGTGGSTGTGFDATLTNDPSSFWFDNTTNTWKPFTTAADASWAQNRGARVLIRGDRTQTTALTGVNPSPLAVTLDMTGAVNTGNQNISVPTAGNFHLVSNPYPSPTDIGTVIDATTNIGTTYWVWNANAATRGAYVPLTKGSGAYNLAMNGAFFVQPSSGTTLAFTESNKVAAATTNLFRTQATQNQLELQVNYNGTYADKLFVRNDNTATATKVLNEDGTKLMNPDVNMYTLATGNEALTLDTRPIASTTVIPMGFTSSLQSNFEIALNSNTLNNGLPIVLKDKFLNTEHVLTASSPYNFTVTADAASQGTNRFELVFRTSAALPTNFVNVAAQQKGSAIEVSFNTANEQNMHSYEVEESKDGSSFTKGTTLEAKNATANSYSWLDANIHNGNNYYRVKAIEKNGVVKYSQVVRVNIGTKRSEFTVYPNPVKGGTINLQLTDIEKGVYTVKVVNNLGQEIAAKQITHNGGSANQTISIGNAPTGKYNMVITNGTTTVTKTVIVE